MSAYPLLAEFDLNTKFSRQAGGAISRHEFLAHTHALAATLPEAAYALNLCTDRYHFAIAFAACALRGTCSLLPPSTAPGLIAELETGYGAIRIDDATVRGAPAQHNPAPQTPPLIPCERQVAVLFTSGSTGYPRPQAKTWGELQGVTKLTLDRLGLEQRPMNIVATVPPQHSYGFESSVLLALGGSASIHSGHPLYPADVHAALESLPPPRMLVTTPVHLDACLRVGFDWPEIALILSATAPLDPACAREAERRFQAPLQEIYGCSEAGAIATRRTTRQAEWEPYAGISLIETLGGRFQVNAPHLGHPRPLADRLKLLPDGRFKLLGREADQVKIAGKRIGLGELNRRLLAIAGVEDGSFILPEPHSTRLAAVIVAPTLSKHQIRRQLAAVLDPVFLPRPLIKVEKLERNATGKLTRATLLEVISRFDRVHNRAYS